MFAGHAHAGKTSLIESILFYTKANNRKGEVLQGTSLSDWSAGEIERKISINFSVLTFPFQNHQLQLIDAPGYADFVGEPIASSVATDAGVIVVDATVGVDVGTERDWEMFSNLGLPRAIFINKTDKDNIDMDDVISHIQEAFSKKAVIFDNWEDSKLVEAIAESDDALLESYLDGKALSPEQLDTAMRKAVLSCQLFPIIVGSAATDKGVDKLLGLIIKYFPSPLERPSLKVTDKKENKEIELTPASDGDLSAFVFKTITDAYVGQLSLIRVFSGKLASNGSFYNITKESTERIGQIFSIFGKEQRPIAEASCGDIIAIAKLKNTHTNDSIGTQAKQLVYPSVVFPEATSAASVKPKTKGDEEKISTALNRLSGEDPTFKVQRNAETKEMIISGMGDLHLTIMVARMKRRFTCEVDMGVPKVPYKETIAKTAKGQGKYKKQSGGRGQYGDVWLELAPLSHGSGFEFVDKIFGGAIPKNYIPSVEKGVKQACAEGVVAGCQLVDVKVTLYDGSYHDVDSSDMAFQIAGAMAFKKLVNEAGPVLLEPIMDVEIVVPDEFMGQITGDINSRRGRMMGMEQRGRFQVLKAHIPLAEMYSYANNLRSITGGRGSYTMRPSSYEQVPMKVAQNIIKAYQDKKAEHEK